LLWSHENDRKFQLRFPAVEPGGYDGAKPNHGYDDAKRCNIEPLFRIYFPANFINRPFMRLRNDLKCEAWDAEYN